ncbi:MAG: TIGR01212 family radical SAM protein [Oscillospiraceae bacterium]|nr:TIGR01212 family radical SAM protein [Oscillospiraceae bacterium]
MSEKFIYSDTNKRYRTQNSYLRQRFGGKVIKAALNGGFTCPNIDGTKGTGGCTYCSALGSGDFGGTPGKPLKEQFEEIKSVLGKKWSSAMYIPYFQANTNTYAPTERLRTLFEEALGFEGVVGLAVSTRPDCISDETADYLEELAERTYLTVELGLQTVHDETARRINRCHTYADFLEGYEKLRKRNVNVGVHIINGLPGETPEMMLETAEKLSRLDIHSIKIHLLHIIKGTVLAEQYERGEFEAMDFEDYINIVCSQIELLPPEVIIERITGDGDRNTLIAPRWSLDKKRVMNGIDKEFVRRDSVQGAKYNAEFGIRNAELF